MRGLRVRSHILRFLIVALLVAPLFAANSGGRVVAQEGGYLGDPPVFDSNSVVIDSSESIAVAALPSVNLSSRTAAVSYFNSYYRGQSQPSIQWTGNVGNCNAGTTSSAFKDDVLLLLMYFRGMAGVPSTISLSGTSSPSG